MEQVSVEPPIQCVPGTLGCCSVNGSVIQAGKFPAPAGMATGRGTQGRLGESPGGNSCRRLGREAVWGEGEAAPPRGHEDGLGNLPGVRERQGGPSESGGRRAGLRPPPPPRTHPWMWAWEGHGPGQGGPPVPRGPPGALLEFWVVIYSPVNGNRVAPRSIHMPYGCLSISGCPLFPKRLRIPFWLQKES